MVQGAGKSRAEKQSVHDEAEMYYNNKPQYILRGPLHVIQVLLLWVFSFYIILFGT